MKFAYIQPWGSYDNETIVAVGMKRKEILAYMRRIGTDEKLIKDFKSMPKHVAQGYAGRAEQCQPTPSPGLAWHMA